MAVFPTFLDSSVVPLDVIAAARILAVGDVVAFPTETVYGLGADATSPEAVAKIYAAKGLPQFNPLISHVFSQEGAEREGLFTPAARRLGTAFWPGPLTLIVPRAPDGTVCDLACAGLATVGLRIPAHPVALALLRAFGRPVAAPSANRSGRISPTQAADVAADLGAAVHILDGGRCAVGVESTIVACLENSVRLLRPGGLSVEAIEAALGHPLDQTPSTGVQAPGMLASHYAPNAALRLNATELRAGELGLDFGGALANASLDLSPQGDLQEAAANLYRFLRTLDARGAATIAVVAVPETGLGAAINDRLRRAAAPRA